MGGTVGVAVMGTILNIQMAALLTPIFAQHASIVASLPKGLSPSNVLLTPSVRATLPADFLGQLTAALAHSLFWLYALMLVLALLSHDRYHRVYCRRFWRLTRRAHAAPDRRRWQRESPAR